METYIKGSYRRSIFESEKGFRIGIFKVKETNSEEVKDFIGRTITFTGYFAELKEDDNYSFYGEYLEHPKYGPQFSVERYERLKPEDKDGVILFLSSDLFPGIGEKQATLIVDTLGETVLERILEEPECLNLVPKLSQKKAKQIVQILEKYEESHTTIVYLTDLGFTMQDALAIYQKYKEFTIQTIENNPYQLIDEIEDITFSKVDHLRETLSIEFNDERRMKAYLYDYCKQLVFQTGNTYFSYSDLSNQLLKMGITDIQLQFYLDELRYMNKIVKDGEDYYLRELYDAEANIALTLQHYINTPKEIYKKLDDEIQKLEEINQITYNDKQKLAIKKALENHILIITGGPGTGKTTILKAIIELYQKLHHYDFDTLIEKTALLAPTGRASKRMSEATLCPASTIHRFLKWNKENNEFAVNEFDKSNKEFIVVDEVSMIDVTLFDHLLKGLTKNVQLILIGDSDQLPSVGPGQVLKDFIDSKTIETVPLDLLYRQSEDSYIATLAQEIKEQSLSDTYLTTTNDYTFLKCNSNFINENLCNVCNQINQKGYDYKRIQVMAPMYAGKNGIDELNKYLQFVFNPPAVDKKELKVGDVIYREQDKVLQLVNMPEENVFNGDIGVITRIVKADISKSKKNEIYIDFDGNEIKLTPKEFLKIKHGYIVSIHKSQGSEFDIVVMPITHSYNRMLYRKLFYTGITRAKKKLILIGEPDAFLKAVQNNFDYVRKTKLIEKLKNPV